MVSTRYTPGRGGGVSKFPSRGGLMFLASRAVSATSQQALELDRVRQAQAMLASMKTIVPGSKGAAAIEAVGCICLSLVAHVTARAT